MRKALMVLVLLAWPLASFGAVNLNLLGGPVIFTPGVDTQIQFDIQVSADTSFDGIEWILDGGSTMNSEWSVSACDDSMNATQLAYMASVYLDFVTPGVSTLQDAIDSGAQVSYFRFIGYTAAGTYNYMRVTLVPVVELTPGTYTLSASGPTTFWTPTGEQLGGTPLEITVTPEPASALLLLLAAPFIRRRTA